MECFLDRVFGYAAVVFSYLNTTLIIVSYRNCLSVTIAWHRSMLMLTSSAISWCSSQIVTRTAFMLSSFVDMKSRPGLAPLSVDVLPVLKRLNHSQYWIRLVQSSPLYLMKHFQCFCKRVTDFEAKFNTNALFFKIFHLQCFKDPTRGESKHTFSLAIVARIATMVAWRISRITTYGSIVFPKVDVRQRH